MPLSPPEGLPPEKILVYGQAKSGKTSAWLSIAELYQQTGTPGTFWCVDTDDAMDRMLWNRQLSNVEVIPAYDWTEYREASSKAVANAQKGDWIVVDFVDRAWEEVRNWYLTEINEESPEEYFLRKKHELKDAGKGGKKHRMNLYDEIDWDVVKPEYNAFIKPIVQKTKAHVFLVCEEKAIWVDNKPSDKTKPGGHGGLPFQVHSIIKLDKLARGYILNNDLGGDRQRDKLVNETYSSFALTYLCKCAGWSVAKEESDA